MLLHINLVNGVNRLEDAACKAIEIEYDRYNKLDSAKSNRTIKKRIEQYDKAKKDAENKIDLYEDFQCLYTLLTEELHVFDNNGFLRNQKIAGNNIKDILNIIISLKHEKITNSVESIQRILPDLLHYFEVAESVINALNDKLSIDEREALPALCLAWQWEKAKIKAKKVGRKKYCVNNEQFCLQIATGLLQEKFDNIKEQVYDELDKIVQSSALVECINSIIRPYLNTSKNHITQETLNLIMYYHNHRRYKDGNRKGKTPMEILTGKEQKKDWIELLFDVVKEKDPNFFTYSKLF